VRLTRRPRLEAAVKKLQDRTMSESNEPVIYEMLAAHPELETCAGDLLMLRGVISACFRQGGKLLLCGNGGSHADAAHIAGELGKSFTRARPLDPAYAARLRELPMGEELSQYLEGGLPAIALGLNGALKTAVENDNPLRDAAFAQEACAIAREGDVLLALSTSGNARNCLMAMSAAKAAGALTAVLTGPNGGAMAEAADLVVRAPGENTGRVQERHIVLYHALCTLIEADLFPDAAAPGKKA
jgi:D-sedoheptulose 7-phosphate isomerase